MNKHKSAKKSKRIKSISIIAFGALILIMAYTIYYNFNSNKEFLYTSSNSMLSVVIAVVISYYLVQQRTESRLASEKVDKFVIKIQESMDRVNSIILKGDETDSLLLSAQRDINSRLSTLIKFDHCKPLEDDFIYVQKHVKSYFDYFYTRSKETDDNEWRNKLNNFSDLINKKLDEVQLDLLKL